MKIDVLIGSPSDRSMVEYVLSTWKHVTHSAVNFRVIEKQTDVSAPMAIVYGFGDNPIKDRCSVVVPRSQIDNEWRYVTLNLDTDLQEDARLKGEMLPVFEGTCIILSSDKTFQIYRHQKSVAVGVDLFFNSFAHLACIEERQKQAEGSNITSYARKLRNDRRFLQKPLVNYYFAVLERCLEMVGADRNLLFPYKKNSSVCLTHDVDVVNNNAYYIIKQLILQGWNATKKPQYAANAVRSVYGRCIKKWSGDGIDEVFAIEKKYDVRSTFFVSGVGCANRNGITHGYKGGLIKRLVEKLKEPVYTVSQQPLKDKLRNIIREGWEVGIHGCSASYSSAERLSLERDHVKNNIEGLHSSGRQHWLTLLHQNSWKAFYEAGITMDCTLGFNDAVGFRAGICHHFKPYVENYDCNILSLPMIVMDSALFDYLMLDEARALNIIDQLFSEVVKFSGSVSILWHSHGFANGPLWGLVYENVIIKCRQLGISTPLMSELHGHELN